MAISQLRLSTLDANLPPVLCGVFRAQEDKDFASLAINRSDLCPVIFVRIGDLRRGPLLAKFESVMQNLTQALNNGDKIIEIA
jgi:predicted nuclease of predicted toxin-antitoxin system